MPAFDDWRLCSKHEHENLRVDDDTDAAAIHERAEAKQALEKGKRLLFQDVPHGLAAVEDASVALEQFKPFVDGFQVDGALALTENRRPRSRVCRITTAARGVRHYFNDDVGL
jgi:hypothetical protein